MQLLGSLGRPVLDLEIGSVRTIVRLEHSIRIVTLCRCEPGPADQMAEQWFAEAVGRARGTDHVLLHHGRTGIVCTAEKCHLRDTKPHGWPRGLDVFDVVEKQTGEGDVAEVFR